MASAKTTVVGFYTTTKASQKGDKAEQGRSAEALSGFAHFFRTGVITRHTNRIQTQIGLLLDEILIGLTE